MLATLAEVFQVRIMIIYLITWQVMKINLETVFHEVRKEEEVTGIITTAIL